MIFFLACLLIITVLARACGAQLCEPLHFAYDPPVDCNVRRERHQAVQAHCVQRQNILSSYPGSGSTWLRKLIENASGLHTGSVYNDRSLHRYFAGEGHVRNTAAIKTHYLTSDWKRGKRDLWPRVYDQYVPAQVVYLVRNPLHALLSEFKRRQATAQGNTHALGQHAFQLNNSQENVAEFVAFFNQTGKKWVYHVVDALRAQRSSRMLIVHYEDLLHHGEPTLRAVLDHLRLTASDDAIRCALEKSGHPMLRRKHDANTLHARNLSPFVVDAAYRVLQSALRVTAYDNTREILALLEDHETL